MLGRRRIVLHESKSVGGKHLHESQANSSKNTIGDDEDKECGGEGGAEDGEASNHRSSHAGCSRAEPENDNLIIC